MIHEIELPRYIVIGENALRSVSDVLSKLGISRDSTILIVTGPNVWPLHGDKLMSALPGGIDVRVEHATQASIDAAENIAQKAMKYNVDIVIGFGGGKAIDLAKYAAFKTRRAMVSIPTSPSHDGVASPFISLKGSDKPYSMRSNTPAAIIADIDILSSAPIRLIRAGAGDLVGKLTAVRDWMLAHKLKGEYYGDYAAKLALLSAKHVLEYAREIGHGSKAGVRVLVEGLISSSVAMCIAGSTRPASGSEHLFSHALDVLYPGKALHGEQVALGTIMMMYLHGGPWKKIRKALKLLGLPVSAEELGIPDNVIVEALTMAHRIRPERYTILGESGLTREAAEKLARVAGVI